MAKKKVATKKPICKLIGGDGNVFYIIGKVRKTLRDAGIPDTADEFTEKAMNAADYDEVLRLCMEYVAVE